MPAHIEGPLNLQDVHAVFQSSRITVRRRRFGLNGTLCRSRLPREPYPIALEDSPLLELR